MQRFIDRTVLITGGSRGIGRALGLAFAQEGARVAFCYREQEQAAASLQDEIEKEGGKSLAFKVLTYDYSQVQIMVKKIIAEFGSIDILINNAGVLNTGPFIGMQEGDWREMIHTNLHGMFTCTKITLPYLMKNKKGVIINISSFTAYRVIGPAQAVYAATKAGIIGFTRSFSKEGERMGIRVNAIAPGLIDTDMIRPLGEKLTTRILGNTIQKRMGTTSEIAKLVLFLASDDAAYISAQTIVIDGGGVYFQF